MKRVAILGATGYIGRSLACEFHEKNEYEVYLFSRSRDDAAKMFAGLFAGEELRLCEYADFNTHQYDVILNCVGIGKPSELRKGTGSIFKVTEEFDNMILDYVEKSPETLYVSLSSGAVYTYGIENGATADSKFVLDVHNILPKHMYGIAKINSEAKHRAHGHLNIVDLRVFSFFSRFVDPDGGFLMSDIVRCIRSGTVLETSGEDMLRDYICTKDLYALVRACIEKKTLNDYFDAYSIKPVSKFELLDFFNKKYGLHYVIKTDQDSSSPTGTKSNYFSLNRKAESLGYMPEHTSLSGIDDEIRSSNLFGESDL